MSLAEISCINCIHRPICKLYRMVCKTGTIDGANILNRNSRIAEDCRYYVEAEK